jgi:hypothetical protein
VPAGQPAALYNVPAVLGFHALAETVAVLGDDVGRGLEMFFHDNFLFSTGKEL